MATRHQGDRRPSDGLMPGAKRQRAAARHYRVQFSELEQLRFRARAMEATRVAIRLHVAQGKDITPATTWDEIIPPYDRAPPELTPYYGTIKAPRGASSESGEAPTPTQWAIWRRHALAPWEPVEKYRPGAERS